MRFYKTNRTLHKWASIIIALPLFVIFLSGILLLVKKEIGFIQPPTLQGIARVPKIEFDEILTIVKTEKRAEINDWQDIDRLDVRPDKGIIKVRSINAIEVQLDASTGEILHVAKRYSDLIESIHDGTYFQKNANLWFTLPIAMVAILISVTGVVLFFLPRLRKRRS